jgi:hypothetical protein
LRGHAAPRDEFIRKRTIPFHVASAPAVIDPNIAANSPSQFSETLQKGGIAGFVF